MQFIIKLFISALLLVLSSELAKRSTLLGSILISLPLTSVLAILWLYQETKNIPKIIDFSWGIFWAVLPSLVFFVVFPLLLKSGMKFGWSMILSFVITFLGYTLYAFVLGKFGIKIL